LKRCTRCLYPDSKPDLHFDEAGVCSACRAYEKRKLTDWGARELELVRILEQNHKPGRYDCIVPSSGGKDSHWQVLKLIEMGARPLVVTATTCHLTETGRKNIDNLSRYATTIEVTPNRTVRAKLNRLGLQMVGDISWPEHVSIFSAPFRVACDMGIPLIFYGECPQEAYGGPPGTEEAKEMTARWVQEFGGLLGLRPSDMIGHDGITEEDMEDYRWPSPERVRQAGIHAYFLGQFYEWDSHRNAEVAKKAGMIQYHPGRGNWWHAENLDNAQTGIHDYFGWLKYGFDRCTAQMSVDIRAGKYTRAQLARHATGNEGTYPDHYAGVPLKDALDRIGVSKAEFESICHQYTNRNIHTPESVSRVA
jgi:N-acetyl sugar amidotransferase